MCDLKYKQQRTAKTNAFSKVTYWWLNKLFREGNRKDLVEEDLFRLKDSSTSAHLCSRLERNWEAELENLKLSGKSPSLARAAFKTFAFKWALFGIVALVKDMTALVIPFLLDRLLRYFDGQSTVTDAYLYGTGITLLSIAFVFLHHLYFYNCEMIGWHIRAATCALMFKKVVRLSQKSQAMITTGKIVNLGATDVIRFDLLPQFAHYIWLGPVQVVAVIVFLWGYLGVSSLVVLAVMLMSMLSQTVFGRLYARFRRKTASHTDARVRLMNEVISAMRVVKMFAWEKPYERLISDTRKQELKKILKSSHIRAYNVSMMYINGRLLTFCAFAVYVALGGRLTPSMAFTVVAWFSLIRFGISLLLAFAVEQVAQSRVSFKRIETFLLLEEIQQPEEEEKGAVQPVVEFSDFVGSWEDVNLAFDNQDDEASGGVALNHINLLLEPSDLLAVIGPVGCGKSSLLAAILGELPAKSGSRVARGRVAYVGQIPWVFSGTLKQNILFGEEYESVRYRRVIQACALTKDLEALENGDETLVGERGVTLSGGQKARVNLARAAYRKETDIVLLDDPLSAVDANVANLLFYECICGLLKDKIRVLVTHQLAFLKDVDNIVVLKEGEIADSGTYEKLQSSGTDFAELLKRDEDKDGVDSVEGNFAESFGGLKSTKRDGEERKDEQAEYVAAVKEEEEKVLGSIGWRSYWEYLSHNKLTLILTILVIPINQGLYVVSDWWISVWAADTARYYEQHSSNASSTSLNLTNFTTASNMPIATLDNSYYIYVFALFTAAFTVTALLRGALQNHHLVMAGKRMHTKMLRSILKAPIRFFDTNPVGRILNRFSKDLGQVDEIMPWVMGDFLWIATNVAAVVLVALVVNYFVILPIIPIIIYFFWLRQYYIRTSRDIKRIEGRARSPVFSHLSSTLQGLTTVRAFRMQDKFERDFHQLQDYHSAAWYTFISCGRWFAIRLDLLSSVFLGFVTYLAIITISYTDADAGQVGLALTYALQLVATFQWGVRQSAEIENQMTSVERIQQYSKLPSEPPHHVTNEQLPPGWPSSGRIEFRDVSFAYYEGGLDVLQSVSVEFKPSEKVGIVGRTGAGKSSLLSCLFRLNELRSGSLLIDGVDVSTVGLTTLRSSISAIPQDPILFAGTLRNNLDPFSNYSDPELWSALDKVQMKETVEAFPQKLEMELAESGSNFSVGQRQLLCLARAILRKNKILAIDEATANVDVRTDKLIQETIRDAFQDCTVITVAHRINSIIDCDRLLVMNGGKVAEFDAPHTLLLDPKSEFGEMVDAVGAAESKALREAAEEAFRARASKQ